MLTLQREGHAWCTCTSRACMELIREALGIPGTKYNPSRNPTVVFTPHAGSILVCLRLVLSAKGQSIVEPPPVAMVTILGLRTTSCTHPPAPIGSVSVVTTGIVQCIWSAIKTNNPTPPTGMYGTDLNNIRSFANVSYTQRKHTGMCPMSALSHDSPPYGHDPACQ